jgi:hypothetical protein
MLVPLAVAALGLVAAVVSVAGHESDTAFVYEQRHPAAIEPGQVERLVAKAPEPVASGKGSVAVSARCSGAPTGPNRNPWRCVVRYASGHRLAYTITIDPRGALRGEDRTGTRTIEGCCVEGVRAGTGG